MNDLVQEQKEAALLALYQGVCGIFFGFFVSAILAAIAVPSFENIVMTHRMAEDFSRMGRLADFLGAFGSYGMIVMLALFLLASWIAIARRINPSLPAFPFHSAPRPVLTWTLVFVSACVFTGMVLLFLEAAQGRVAQSGPAFFGLSAAAGTAAWLMVSPAGMACRLLPVQEVDGYHGRIGTALLGAGFGLMAGGLLKASVKVFEFLFRWILEIGCPSFEMNFSQGLMVYSLPVGICAVLFAVCFGLAPAWSVDHSSLGVRLRRCLIPAAILAASGTWVFGLHRTAVSENHWKAGSLVKAAGLPDTEAPVWTLVVLGADGKAEPTMKPWPAEAKALSGATSGDSAVVPATEGNRKGLEAFLAGPGRRSRFRRSAADALPRIPEALWDRESAFRAWKAVSYVFGESILPRAMETAWLVRSAPVTAANRARLERLSDPDLVIARGRGALNLAKAWHRFGDTDRARHWLDVAALTYRAGKKEELALPAGGTFPDGSVSGRVLLDNKPLAGAVVGVFKLGESARVMEPPRPGMISIYLAESRVLGKDGAFRFDRLSDGLYGLSLLVPPGAIPAAAKLKASKLPGVLTLSPRSAKADLGSLSLTTGR